MNSTPALAGDICRGIELTEKQAHAINEGVRWALDPNAPRCFYVIGLAGTGKTTIARLIVDAIMEAWRPRYAPLRPGVLYVAPTNRAAQALASKGCSPAMTLHRALYSPPDQAELEAEAVSLSAELAELKATGGRTDQVAKQLAAVRRQLSSPEFTLREDNSVQLAELVVVDEASMVGGRNAEDLLRTARKLLVIGDHGQLPPVASGQSLLPPPAGAWCSELTEVKRQGEGSEILQLAYQVRLGGCVSVPSGGEVTRATRLTPQHMAAADMILVGTHKSRCQVNDWIRAHRGFSGPMAQVGETLLCRSSFKGKKGLFLPTGSFWRVLDAVRVFPKNTSRMAPHARYQLARADTGEEGSVYVFDDVLVGGEVPMHGRAHMWSANMNFGYAATVHAAQGSEWPTVLLYDEASKLSRGPRAEARSYESKWRYTGVTRAARRLIYCRPA